MQTSALVFSASAAALLTLLAARPAHAIGPVDIEIAGKAGYGSNDLDFGLGGRAGVSIFGLYGGFNIVNYFGQNSASLLTYGGEVGYGFTIAFITLRPLVGFGDAVASTPGPGCAGTAVSSCPSTSTSTFYVQPGGLIQFAFGHLIFGVDASALIPTASGSQVAFTMDGQVGVKF
jgi:hypothetical protein